MAVLRATLAKQDVQIHELEKALSVGASVGACSSYSVAHTASTGSLVCSNGNQPNWNLLLGGRLQDGYRSPSPPATIPLTAGVMPAANIPAAVGTMMTAGPVSMCSTPIASGQAGGDTGSIRDRSTSPTPAMPLFNRDVHLIHRDTHLITRGVRACQRSMSPAFSVREPQGRSASPKASRMKEVRLRTSPPRRTANGALHISANCESSMMPAGARLASAVRRLEGRAPLRSLSPPGPRPVLSSVPLPLHAQLCLRADASNTTTPDGITPIVSSR